MTHEIGTVFTALAESAERVAEWHESHGVIAGWRVTPDGFELGAWLMGVYGRQSGHTRAVSYAVIDHATMPSIPLRGAEAAVMAALNELQEGRVDA